MTDLPANHQIGANNPPPDPFTAIQVHITDLEVEAQAWCDGDPITTQSQADEVSRLIEDFRKAHQAADDQRKKDNEPFDRGKDAVQAKYAPLIADTKKVTGITVKCQTALRALLTPYLRKLEDDKRAAAIEAQRVADEAAAQAAATRAAANPANLAEQDQAEAATKAASDLQAEAKRAGSDKAHATGGSRAMGLRTHWITTIVDRRAALNYCAATDPEALAAFVLSWGQREVAAGRRKMPGFEIKEDRRA